MNDRQLRSFVLAAELGSFSKAASASYISTSAFAQQITLLEKDLGFPLFNRSHSGATLTKQGERFLEAARSMLSVYDETVRQCREEIRAKNLSLRIAHPQDTLPQAMQDAYQAFMAAHPTTKISFVRKPLPGHFDALRKDEIDITLIAEPTDAHLEGLEFIPLANETYAFCMRTGHPLSLRKTIRASDLVGYRILCGNYPYLKLGFAEGLPEEIELEAIESPYDMAVRARIMGTSELFVIHKHWAQEYSNALAVVPSRIKAGRIGAVIARKRSGLVDEFVDALRTHL